MMVRPGVWQTAQQGQAPLRRTPGLFLTRPVHRALFGLVAGCLSFGTPANDDLFFKDMDEVNEGVLHFLTQLPDKPVHHHQNIITIHDSSLTDGWVRLEQCHAHLDQVPSTQVLYREDFIRNLRLVSHSGIDRVWVQGPSVQLENVGAQGMFCIQADTRALSTDANGDFLLRNGPYMRRFLDGYYPMQVSLTVHLATDKIHFQALQPVPQPGLHLAVDGKTIQLKATFEGRLRTEMRFAPDAPQPRLPPVQP